MRRVFACLSVVGASVVLPTAATEKIAKELVDAEINFEKDFVVASKNITTMLTHINSALSKALPFVQAKLKEFEAKTEEQKNEEETKRKEALTKCGEISDKKKSLKCINDASPKYERVITLIKQLVRLRADVIQYAILVGGTNPKLHRSTFMEDLTKRTAELVKNVNTLTKEEGSSFFKSGVFTVIIAAIFLIIGAVLYFVKPDLKIVALVIASVGLICLIISIVQFCSTDKTETPDIEASKSFEMSEIDTMKANLAVHELEIADLKVHETKKKEELEKETDEGKKAKLAEEITSIESNLRKVETIKTKANKALEQACKHAKEKLKSSDESGEDVAELDATPDATADATVDDKSK